MLTLAGVKRYYAIKFRNHISEEDYVQVWDDLFNLVCRIGGESVHVFEKLPDGFTEAIRTLSSDFEYGQMHVVGWDGADATLEPS